jgi:hypothetical protein
VDTRDERGHNGVRGGASRQAAVSLSRPVPDELRANEEIKSRYLGI